VSSNNQAGSISICTSTVQTSSSSNNQGAVTGSSSSTTTVSTINNNMTTFMAMSSSTSSTSSGDNSMRCTLRRGRPNTPKSGLSVEYRIRKSSVPSTPECAKSGGANSNDARANQRAADYHYHYHQRQLINNTISNDADLAVALHQRQLMGGGSIHGSTAARKLLQHSIASSHPDATLSSSSLNTAMVIQDQV
jgi:hypothetical protein